jgi:hypothetical protein
MYAYEAEALIRTAKWRWSLNEVRVRPYYAKNNATKADLKNERRCELHGVRVFRHLDLVRGEMLSFMLTNTCYKVTSAGTVESLEVIEVWPPVFQSFIHHYFDFCSKFAKRAES